MLKELEAVRYPHPGSLERVCKGCAGMKGVIVGRILTDDTLAGQLQTR